MNDLIKKYDIDETLTRPSKQTKKKRYNRIKDNIPLKEDYNFMADVLHLPKDKKGYQYLLVVVDLATDEFDMEPMKTENSDETLKAIKAIFQRNHLNKPYASIRTDGGASFKKGFAKYLYDESILHNVALAGRHKQMSAVESLNRTLGRFFNGYMNSIELKTGKIYREWTDIVDKLRIDMNKLRKKDVSNIDLATHKYPVPDTTKSKPKYNVGDFVYRKLDKPKNALNETINSDVFREGDFRFDPIPVKIKQILYYPGKVTYRYMLSGIKNASFTEDELMPAPDAEEEQVEIKMILDKRFFDGEDHYQVWMYGELKKDAGWYAKSDLLKTVDKKLLDDFDKSIKKKKKR